MNRNKYVCTLERQQSVNFAPIFNVFKPYIFINFALSEIMIFLFILTFIRAFVFFGMTDFPYYETVFIMYNKSMHLKPVKASSSQLPNYFFSHLSIIFNFISWISKCRILCLSFEEKRVWSTSNAWRIQCNKSFKNLKVVILKWETKSVPNNEKRFKALG